MPKLVAPSLALVALSLAPRLALAQDGTPFPTPSTYSPLEEPAPVPAPPSAASAPSAPSARTAPRFGEAGQLVVTGSTSLGATSLRYSTSDASRDSVSGVLGFDWFLVKNVSVGLDLEASYSDSKGYGADGSLVETKAKLLSGGPRVGVNLPLGERLSFYPRLLLGMHWTNQEVGVVSGKSASVASSPLASPTMSRTGPWLDLYAPLDFHVAPGFFLGAGPRLYHDFARAQGGPDVGGERTILGVDVEVGGYWGGPHEEPAAPAPSSAPPAPRFGDAGTFVIANDFVVDGSVTSYSGSEASFKTLTIAPGIDYFASDRISLGIGLSYGNSSSVGFEPDGTRVENDVGSFGIGPRVGFDVPLASWLSLYPRLALGVSVTTYDETAGGRENKYTSTNTWMSFSAPLLVHVVPHFFVGLGPYLTRDLTQSFDVPAPENDATRVGASALVGGWF
jgi:hypothetical protein